MTYNQRLIENKWQKRWQESQEQTIDKSKKKLYVLEMFPYPSGKIHMGHVRNYTLGDVMTRYKKMKGYSVLHPMGWDAFGLPAENAAIANNIHPKLWTYNNIQSMKKQLEPLGFDYDWNRELATCDPLYYKHEQAMFIDFFIKGIAYQKEAIVNWDPVDHTVLANEQVENGRGWRSGALIERKKLRQWFLRTTDFADKLLDNLETLTGWPNKVLSMQHHWIGRSHGAEISFNTNYQNQQITVYTTKPETIYGISFLAISYDHSFTYNLTDPQVLAFIEECKHLKTSEEEIGIIDKKGVATGYYAFCPISSKKVPIYIANFVLSDYGHGAIFGCPAHDERDYEFATKYNLPILQVIESNEGTVTLPYCQEGNIINSEFLDGMTTQAAKLAVIKKLEELKYGSAKVHYRLRDWGISRQRYWGCPIPMIHCKTCGIIPVPKEHLPVELPEDVDFNHPGNPLERHPTWKHVQCPKCQQNALRDTDTFDTFFESSWYFLRFCSPHTTDKPFDLEEVKHWMPVDQYIGGIEHAVMHLLYARFFCQALQKCGYFEDYILEEPFTKLLAQGMICHETYRDKNGKWFAPEEIKIVNGTAYRLDNGQSLDRGRVEKMSKSKKNTIDPDSMVLKYGADTVRLFVLSDSPPDRDLEWSEAGADAMHRYLSKIYNFCYSVKDLPLASPEQISKDVLYILHRTIKLVSEDIEAFFYNKAIARLRELTNFATSKEQCSAIEMRYILYHFTKLLWPFAPHIAEELHSWFSDELIMDTEWPQYDPQYIIKNNITIAMQINGKMRGTLDMSLDASEQEVLAEAQKHPLYIKHLPLNKIQKVIYIKNRTINIIGQ